MNRLPKELRLAVAACAAWLAAHAPLGASPGQLSTVPEGLRSYLQQFTGSSPTNCDRPGVQALIPGQPTPLDQVMQCVAEAKQEGRPFFVYDTGGLIGPDSWAVSGILMTPQGEGFRFNYDSSPCGGSGCSDRFVVSRCQNPTITGLGIGLRLGCDPVPSPNRRLLPAVP